MLLRDEYESEDENKTREFSFFEKNQKKTETQIHTMFLMEDSSDSRLSFPQYALE